MPRASLTLLLLALAAIPASAQQPPLPSSAPVAVTLHSNVLRETRTVLVRTPASYATHGRAYPVLYMTDGDGQIAHTVATVEYLAREGRIPELIVVGISNTDRTRDLTPTKLDALRGATGAALATRTSGGGDRFLDFISRELIPHVEKNYRTLPYRVFAGHSFGGLLAMHAFFTRPALFQAVIAVSPTLTWDDRYVHRRATEWAKNPPRGARTLVFSVGDEGAELDREFDALKSLLEEHAPKDLIWQALRFPDEDHGSVVLPTHYAGLRKVFEPLRFPLEQGADPATLWARARDHYAAASSRFGFTVPVPERTANLIGYRLLQAGDLPAAIEVFRSNATTYPQSANVHDSLGEALERAGSLPEAAASYRRAAELGKKHGDPNTAVFEQNAKRLSGK